MNIIKHLEWETPSIEIEDGAFCLEITEGNIEIACEWDHGWGGRGRESISIPLQTFCDLMDQYRQRV